MVDLCSIAKHSFVSEFLMGLMTLHHLFIDREERAQACRFLQKFTFCAAIDRIMLWFVRHFLNQLTGRLSRADMKT